MENKGILKFVLPTLIVLAVLGFGYYLTNLILKNIASETLTTGQTDNNSFEIDQKAYSSIVKTSDSNINFDGSGSGRENPFAPYK